jgi:hypothetical protein
VIGVIIGKLTEAQLQFLKEQLILLAIDNFKLKIKKQLEEKQKEQDSRFDEKLSP